MQSKALRSVLANDNCVPLTVDDAGETVIYDHIFREEATIVAHIEHQFKLVGNEILASPVAERLVERWRHAYRLRIETSRVDLPEAPRRGEVQVPAADVAKADLIHQLAREEDHLRAEAASATTVEEQIGDRSWCSPSSAAVTQPQPYIFGSAQLGYGATAWPWNVGPEFFGEEPGSMFGSSSGTDPVRRPAFPAGRCVGGC